MFEKLFGKKKTAAPSHEEPKAQPQATGSDAIRAVDSFGREIQIPRETWRTKVLPDMLKTHWDDPERLYPVLTQAFGDGFLAEIGAAAEHLHATDPAHGRAACLWSALLMKQARVDEAERVVDAALARVGDDAYLLAQLAQIYHARNAAERVDETLWRALVVDPNHEGAGAWYLARERERHGEEAGLAALQRIAALPGSWRAQLVLAQNALKAADLAQAVALYEEALSRSPRPVPPALLMQMSGELGRAGHLRELVTLTEPHFVPEVHGLDIGNNLLKAHVDRGELDAAREILDRLYALKQPGFQQNLNFWDQTIARARTEKAVVPENPKVAMLTLDGPVWLPPESEGTELVAAKRPDAPQIFILGSSAETANDTAALQLQMADAAGRVSRALPLFLAEQIDLCSSARAVAFMPWIVAEGGGGFVFSGRAWSDEETIGFAKQSGAATGHAVLLYVRARQEPWSVDVKILRLEDGAERAVFNLPLALAQIQDAAPQLAERVLAALAQAGALSALPPPLLYQVPTGTPFRSYLLRLEQLLSVRCAAMDTASPHFLSGEREIVEGNIALCLECPDNFTTRLLLAKTLDYMKRVRPQIPLEFKERLALLAQQKPLIGLGSETIQAIIAKAVA